MTFLETVEQARGLLQRNGRVSFRGLAREFELDDDALAELVEELVDVQQVAAREGKVLSWIGGALETQAAAPTTEAAPAASEAERRQLTVMFCDLVGSTELSTRLDAEELAERVRAYQAASVEVIERFGGRVAQYLGDGLLVYFGHPQAHDDDAERAVRSGLGIVGALAGKSPVRIGIHTGPVVVQAMGSGEKRETLALGETTNLAARLQGLAAPDTVVLSEATRRLVRGIFAVEELGPQRLKGFAEPVLVHRAVRPTGVRSRLDLAAGRLTPFVGRDLELATLVDRFERAAEGEGQNVLVLGEAGVGKSRLAHQLHERLASIPHSWLECGATPYTQGTPFHPVSALVSQALAFGPADTAEVKVARLEGGLGKLATPETVALLVDFLGLPQPTPFTMSPDLQRRKTLDLLAQWTLALSEVQPLVVVVEDLHWCDASSLELLGRLVAQSATARMLLLVIARPEFTPTWPARENVTTLSLARLTKRQARDMIAALARGDLPAETLDALVARADGVPLFVEELTKSVVEPGAGRGVEAIPATLADSLMARLDRLSTAKEVAQRAAVLGREFAYPLLAAIAGLEEPALRHGLARLVEGEILFARGEPPDATYSFKHALVQEAAYESLLKRTRQQLHGRIVDVLVKEFSERAAVEPEAVARHAEAAGRSLEAIACYERAAEQARERSAYEEAIRHLRQAIALLATQPEARERDTCEAALQLTLGHSLAAARGYAHAEVGVAYERARVLSEALEDARALGLALYFLAIFWGQAGQVDRSGVLLARVLSMADETSDADLALSGHGELGLVEYFQGKFASSLGHCEAALALSDERHHARAIMDRRVVGLGISAWDLWVLGWPDRALARAREALAFARELGHPFSLGGAVLYATVVHLLRRAALEQRERAAELMALAEAHGFPFWLGLARTFHAAARVAAGEPEAVADLMPGLTQSGGTGSRVGAPGALQVVGAAYLAAGRPSEARSAVEGGLVLAAQTGQPASDAALHRLRGEIVLATGGAPADAEAHFQRALEIARSQEARSYELQAATSLARLWRDQGKRAEARTLLTPIYDWFTEGFDTLDLVEAKGLLEEIGA